MAPTSDLSAKEQWLEAAREQFARQAYVSINLDDLDKVTGAISVVADFTYWRKYVGTVDDRNPDLKRLAYEMALTTGLIGGYMSFDSQNEIQKWELRGSGSDALFAMLDEIRAEGALPDPRNGLSFNKTLRDKIAPIFDGKNIPYPAFRLAIYEEIGVERAVTIFDTIIDECREGNAFSFTFKDVIKLSEDFPVAFGGDKFYKKASLYFMFMTLALTELGFHTKLDTIAPSEYRQEHIFRILGLIKLSPALEKKINSGEPLDENGEELNAIRTANILIMEELCKKTGLSMAHLDGSVYMFTKTEAFRNLSAGTRHLVTTKKQL